MNLRPLIRSLIFLATGALAGFGFRQCRSLETIAPVAAASAIPTAAPASAPDPAKIRAAARVWFDANKRTTPPTYGNYELIESPPTREIDRIEALTSAGLREWLEEGRANGADGRLMDMLMERWGEVDMPAFVAWIEFLGTQPRPRIDHSGACSFPGPYAFLTQILPGSPPRAACSNAWIPRPKSPKRQLLHRLQVPRLWPCRSPVRPPTCALRRHSLISTP